MAFAQVREKLKFLLISNQRIHASHLNPRIDELGNQPLGGNSHAVGKLFNRHFCHNYLNLLPLLAIGGEPRDPRRHNQFTRPFGRYLRNFNEIVAGQLG